MIVSCGLNVGKLLRVLHEGLLKEDTHVAPLMSLVGNEVLIMCTVFFTSVTVSLSEKLQVSEARVK